MDLMQVHQLFATQKMKAKQKKVRSLGPCWCWCYTVPVCPHPDFLLREKNKPLFVSHCTVRFRFLAAAGIPDTVSTELRRVFSTIFPPQHIRELEHLPFIKLLTTTVILSLEGIQMWEAERAVVQNPGDYQSSVS